jgi:hypothetical protein
MPKYKPRKKKRILLVENQCNRDLGVFWGNKKPFHFGRVFVRMEGGWNLDLWFRIGDFVCFFNRVGFKPDPIEKISLTQNF